MRSAKGSADSAKGSADSAKGSADSAKEKVIAVKIESQVKNGEQYDYDESTKSLN